MDQLSVSDIDHNEMSDARNVWGGIDRIDIV